MLTSIWTKNKKFVLLFPVATFWYRIHVRFVEGSQKELDGLKRKRNVDIGWSLKKKRPVEVNANASNGKLATGKLPAATNGPRQTGAYFRCTLIWASHFLFSNWELEVDI